MTGVLVGLGLFAFILWYAWSLQEKQAGAIRTRGCGWCGYGRNKRGYPVCRRCGRPRDTRQVG
jgi:hypothetical protein